MIAATLEHAIAQKTAKVGVIGLGYVGLPLVRAFLKAGFPTMGFDIDPVSYTHLTLPTTPYV